MELKLSPSPFFIVMTLDLTIFNTYQSTSLGIIDVSLYDGNIINPSLEITPPGFPKVNVEFTPDNINIYNSIHLLPNCDSEIPLPDGIYTIKYSIQPNQINYVEKSFIRVEEIKCKYQKILLAVDNNCSCNTSGASDLKRQLRSIKLLIEGSIASTNNCDYKTATEMYRKAYSLLDKLKICDC